MRFISIILVFNYLLSCNYFLTAQEINLRLYEPGEALYCFRKIFITRAIFSRNKVLTVLQLLSGNPVKMQRGVALLVDSNFVATRCRTLYCVRGITYTGSGRSARTEASVVNASLTIRNNEDQ